MWCIRATRPKQLVSLGEQRQRGAPQARQIFGKRIGRRHGDPDSTIFRRTRRVPSAPPIQFVVIQCL